MCNGIKSLFAPLPASCALTCVPHACSRCAPLEAQKRSPGRLISEESRFDSFRAIIVAFFVVSLCACLSENLFLLPIMHDATALHVRSACCVLYDPGSSAGARGAADAALQEFLKGGAGAVLGPCASILADPASAGNPSLTLFAAHALHSTLRACVVKERAQQRSHVQLDEAAWCAMRGALVELANRSVVSFSAAVVTQLALALSALALKMVSWSAQNVVPELIASLHGAVRAEVLRLFPEELASLSMHPQRRLAHTSAAAQHAPLALDCLWESAARGELGEAHALEAAAPWLRRGHP